MFYRTEQNKRLALPNKQDSHRKWTSLRKSIGTTDHQNVKLEQCEEKNFVEDTKHETC